MILDRQDRRQHGFNAIDLYGTPKKQLDVSRLAALGWRARIPLAEGLRSTVAQFREDLNQQLVGL